MILWRDRLELALGDLWRMKLRTFLTTAGVVIAIAAFVAMLSFGAGMQQNIAEQFDQLGLFNTILVYPGEESDSDTTTAALLNDSTVIDLSGIPGVTHPLCGLLGSLADDGGPS